MENEPKPRDCRCAGWTEPNGVVAANGNGHNTACPLFAFEDKEVDAGYREELARPNPMTDATKLIEQTETIANMIEDRVFSALDINDATTLRLVASALAAAQAENGRLREAIKKAKDHTTPIGGSFRRWHEEITSILADALATATEGR